MQVGLPKLGTPGPLDDTTQLLGEELHAVADSEHWNPKPIEARIDPRGAFRVHGRGPA